MGFDGACDILGVKDQASHYKVQSKRNRGWNGRIQEKSVTAALRSETRENREVISFHQQSCFHFSGHRGTVCIMGGKYEWGPPIAAKMSPYYQSQAKALLFKIYSSVGLSGRDGRGQHRASKNRGVGGTVNGGGGIIFQEHLAL